MRVAEGWVLNCVNAERIASGVRGGSQAVPLLALACFRGEIRGEGYCYGSVHLPLVKLGREKVRAVPPSQWAAVTPHSICSVPPLKRRGDSRVESRYGYCSSCICLLVSLGSPNVCFAEHTVWIQDLRRPIYVTYLCLCCGKMLQLCVFIYLVLFVVVLFLEQYQFSSQFRMI